jgi:hypothetical protein
MYDVSAIGIIIPDLPAVRKTFRQLVFNPTCICYYRHIILHVFTFQDIPQLQQIYLKNRMERSKDRKKKKSGVRTKFLIESLRKDYYALRDENDRLREIVQSNLPKDVANAILADCFDLTSPSAKLSDVDEIDDKMKGTGIAEEDLDDE